MRALMFAGLYAAGACGGSDGTTGGEPILPAVAEATFVAQIDNPYFPLPAGASWVYESVTDEGVERVEVTVTSEQKSIQGVAAVVVRDTVTLGGKVTEDTRDWFAQDSAGNVWYLGEDTCVFEDGACVDKEGSWEWGKDGAVPGIVMPATPSVDARVYRQEYYPGHAEDTGEVIAVGNSVTTRAGSFSDCVRTHDASTLDSKLDEQKTYCRRVGLVLTIEDPDVTEELVSRSGL